MDGEAPEQQINNTYIVLLFINVRKFIYSSIFILEKLKYFLLIQFHFCKVAHEFIDSIRGKKPEKSRIIVSSHNYQYTPSVEDLGNLVAKIQATGANIVKFATTALNITDVARVFQITVHSQVSSV